MVIVDADVIIEVLRKNPVAESYLKQNVGHSNVLLSAVTVAEIQRGAIRKENLDYINRLLCQYVVHPIDHLISDIFSSLVRKFVLSHDTGICDMIVAATSLRLGFPLLTMNKKHFKHIPSIELVEHDLKPLEGCGQGSSVSVGAGGMEGRNGGPKCHEKL